MKLSNEALAQIVMISTCVSVTSLVIQHTNGQLECQIILLCIGYQVKSHRICLSL